MLARILSLILNIKRSKKALEDFENILTEKCIDLLRAKLDFEKEDENNLILIKQLLGLLGESNSIDYTAFYKPLSHYNGTKTKLLVLCTQKTPLSEWLDDYKKSQMNTEIKRCLIPIKIHLEERYTSRSYNKAENEDDTLLNDLLKLLQKPYDEHPEFERYAKPTPSN